MLTSINFSPTFRCTFFFAQSSTDLASHLVQSTRPMLTSVLTIYSVQSSSFKESCSRKKSHVKRKPCQVRICHENHSERNRQRFSPERNRQDIHSERNRHLLLRIRQRTRSSQSHTCQCHVRHPCVGDLCPGELLIRLLMFFYSKVSVNFPGEMLMSIYALVPKLPCDQSMFMFEERTVFVYED